MLVESLRCVWRRSVRSLSDVFFFPSETQRWRVECHAEGGEMEILLSINCLDKAPRVFTMVQLSLTDQTWPSPNEKGKEMWVKKKQERKNDTANLQIYIFQDLISIMWIKLYN